MPNKYRGIGLAWTELTQLPFTVAGTLLSNTIITNATWRLIFWIAIGYGGFSLVGTALVYFPPSHPRLDGKTRWQEFKELDWVGTILFTVGLSVFLFGLNAGGNSYLWTSAATLAPLILGMIVLLASFAYDFTSAKDPLFPWYLFRNFREFSSLPVLVFVVCVSSLYSTNHQTNVSVGRYGVFSRKCAQRSDNIVSPHSDP